VFAPNTVVTARNRDRTRFSSWGSKGGRPGNTSCFWRNQGRNDAVDLGNTDVVPLDPGDVILVTSSGGGGFGPAAERDPKAVLFDVQQGKVSVQAAADDYGVVIRDGAIDEMATAARRARLSASTKLGIFAFNAEREAYEREWTDANYAALTEVLATLPVNWRHYMKKRIFAAMAELPAHQRRGDGNEVRRAFELARAEFPQLRQAQAAE
jgi:N-methylhydantoinase B